MKLLFAIVCLCALIANTYAITCYTCASCAPSSNQTSTGCTVCQNTYGYIGNLVVSTTKVCATTCTQSDTRVAGIGAVVNCCYTDLCNGAMGKGSTILIGLGLTSFIFFFSRLI
ncbi:hypothetical protein Ciccas_007038 [Cichlidogyrus casuarinus]|uniref:Snake toxin/toxin-like domain-containing protein n=1 Tax=Cichlidogyrus casuarinus TaxID=1844966 RepID=A0ABD2Q404_9PLAT